MKLRQAYPDDALKVARVLRESYNISSIEEGKQIFLDELAKNIRYIAAENNGIIMGLVSWFTHGLPKHGLVELDRIAVLPECRGKGISKTLFLMLVHEAECYYREHNSRLRKLFLMTHADNTRAQSFYQKMGMKHEATLPSHFYPEKDEFVMSVFF
jgi:ribosomal protein S18 acetylase RimI-like enzyme